MNQTIKKMNKEMYLDMKKKSDLSYFKRATMDYLCTAPDLNTAVNELRDVVDNTAMELVESAEMED